MLYITKNIWATETAFDAFSFKRGHRVGRVRKGEKVWKSRRGGGV